LLGCVLEHETAEGLVAVELTEVEAYTGQNDPASHAFRGQTGRNAVMFGPAGHAYVYFTYGMHFCVNVVCQPEGIPEAVLLRAGRVIEGEGLAAARRSALRPAVASPGTATTSSPDPAPPNPVLRHAAPGRLAARDLARGPARLCQAMAITRAQNGADLCGPASDLRLRPNPGDARASDPPTINAGPRVGVSSAADRPWRFWLADDPTVSVYRPYKKRLTPRA